MKHTIPNRLKIAGVTAGLVGLMACAPSSDRVYTQFHQEAGAIADVGFFGNASLNNQLVQTGERDFTYQLAQRFADDVDSMVTFDFNSARLDETAKATLRQQATWIRQFPEVRFKVFGHADAVGSNSYNKAIGKRRANAAVRYLVSQGISRKRLAAVVSFGENQPLIVTEGRERKNRRTVTEVSGFVGRHPTVLDGKYAQVIHREYIASATAPTGLTESFAGTSAE